MASAKGKKKRIAASVKANRARAKRLRHEKAKSKKLGYSLTDARRRRERAASKKFVETAQKLSPYIPKLKKLAKKKRLTTAEKAEVTRLYKRVKHMPLKYLHPIPKGEKKAFSGVNFAKDVNAIGLNNFSTSAEVKAINDDIIIVSNGRTWLLWKLDKATVRNRSGQFDAAARKAFKAQFPLEIAGALAEKAFKELKVERVSLWITSGRQDRTFEDIGSFLRYLHSRLHAGVYVSDSDESRDPSKFINGLAIQISEPPKQKKKRKK